MFAPTASRFVTFFKDFVSLESRPHRVARLDSELLTPHLKRDLGIVDYDASREPKSRIFDLIRLSF